MSTTDNLPFHLRANFAPVWNEVTAFDLPVQGTIPRDLRGLSVRNGPNPKDPSVRMFTYVRGLL